MSWQPTSFDFSKSLTKTLKQEVPVVYHLSLVSIQGMSTNHYPECLIIQPTFTHILIHLSTPVLLPSFESGCNCCLSPAGVDFPWSPWLFKDDSEGPCRTSASFLSTLIQPLIGSHWFLWVEFSQLVLASVLMHCW